MEQKQESGVHKLVLAERKLLALTGVKEVLSFDAKEVVLETTRGVLILQGDGMNVKRLLVEQGELELEGRIDSLTYTNREKKDAGSFFARLFR